MIGYIGLTHLGLVYAIAAAKKGKKVIGYSDDEELIKGLKQNKVPFYEPNITKELKKNEKKLEFTSKIRNLHKCKIIFFSYDVPTDKNNKSNFNFINKKLRFVLKNLNKRSELVILSQVKPGFTRKIDWPKKKLHYMVETLIMGSALDKALSPKRIIIGSKNKKIGKGLKNFLSKFTKNIINTSYESAELTKISINLMLISSITMTNVLSEICEKIDGDWDEIKRSLQLDKRIGKHAYLRPGLGILSGNLQRDLVNLNEITYKYRLQFPNSILKILTKYSNHKKKWILNILKKLNLSKNTKIALLGLTYKENINSLKNSPSISLIKKLKDQFFNVYDPKIKNELKFQNIKQYNNLSKTISKSDVIIIATPWKEFEVLNLNNSQIKSIIDPYGILRSNLTKRISYFKMGGNIDEK